MYEIHSEERVRQVIDDRVRRARQRRLVARVKASRPRSSHPFA